MPKEREIFPESKGISPKYWRLIPSFPKFGSLTDYYGGKASGSDERNVKLDALRETKFGLVEYHVTEEGISMYAEHFGIGLNYDKEGKIQEIGVKLFEYLGHCLDGDVESMGGENVSGVMRRMLQEEVMLYLNFNLAEKYAVIAKKDYVTNKRVEVENNCNHNFSEPYILTTNFEEYKLTVGFGVVDDEFLFKVLISKLGEAIEVDGDIQATKLLIDCNYKTFLESKYSDKLERLAKRVFLIKD